MPYLRTALCLFIVFSTTTTAAYAQRFAGSTNGRRPSQPVPGLDRIRVDEQLNEQLPLDLMLTDQDGQRVQLRDYFDGERPVLLTFAYHNCNTLCSMVLSAAANGVKDVDWKPGDEFRMVTISIDPRDTVDVAAAKRRHMLELVGREDADWDFLIADQATIDAATEAAGYRYFYNANQDVYAHPAAVMFMTPEGKFARYLYGLQLNPNDVRFGLLEASEGRSISTAEQILLYCYAYDPAANSYTLLATNIMKAGGVVTMTLLGGALFFFWRRERRRKGFGGEAAPSTSRAEAPHDPRAHDASAVRMNQELSV